MLMITPEIVPHVPNPFTFHPIGEIAPQDAAVLGTLLQENESVLHGNGIVVTVDVCGSTKILNQMPKMYVRLMRCVRTPLHENLGHSELPAMALWSDTGDGFMLCVPQTLGFDGFTCIKQDCSVGRALSIARLCGLIIAQERSNNGIPAVLDGTDALDCSLSGQGGIKIIITQGSLHLFKSFGIGFGGSPCHEGARLSKAVSAACGPQDSAAWAHGVVFALPRHLLTPDTLGVASMQGLSVSQYVHDPLVGEVAVMIPRDEPAFYPGSATQ